MLKNMNVRFFVWGYEENENGLFEVDEFEFDEFDGEITYKRHMVRENGVSQICLTKMPRG